MENPEQIDDLTTLVTLDEQQLLSAIKKRFIKDKIYTYISDILIAVNPYKELPLYGPEIQRLYRGLASRDEQPPHIFALADGLYQSMRNTNRNQCCVVSGESGAGKTESTKYIVKHIAQLSQHEISDLHERIIMMNPLLEAFGNAQTVLNNNSSRFGKYIQLTFNKDGAIIEAHITEYLLEKSRIVSQALGEKNFHIFYYMFAGIPEEVLKANKIEDPNKFRIVKPIDGSPVFESVEEKVEYKKMWETLQTLFKITGFKDQEEEGILATLAAILHLTNIVFIKDDQANDDSVIIENEENLEMAAQLLMVDCEELAKALISNVVILQGSGDQMISMKNLAQANDGRDALAKALYGRMFAWTVRQINILLRPEGRRRVVNTTSIGILDLAGFENFEHNSFEQLCINVANEKLQNFFNHHIFELEMKEYKNEGIEGKDITFVDNTALLDMFTKSRMGFFAILDDQMKMPSPSDEKFLYQITDTFKSNPNFQRPKGLNLDFVISHYAGQVIYDTTNFLEKNRDTLSNNLNECLKNSESDFICKMFHAQISDRGSMISKIIAPERSRTSVLTKTSPINVTASTKGSRISVAVKAKARQMKPPGRRGGGDTPGNTIGQQFMVSLNHLMENLTSCDPHFIRCIKPNLDKLPDTFEDDLVLKQLRYTGVLETVRIRQEGYASRLPFDLFLERYKLLYSGSELTGTPADKCTQVLQMFDLKDYQIGKSKVFLRIWHTERLQMQIDRIKAMIRLQAGIRGFLARNSYEKMIAEAKRQEQEVSDLCQKVAQLSTSMYETQESHYKRDVETKPVSVPAVKNQQNDSGKIGVVQSKQQISTSPAMEMIKEELHYAFERFSEISEQIWAKLFYMERGELVGKVYIRDWNVTINGSDEKYNGKVIGLRNSAFDNPHMDAETKEIRAKISQGVELMRDEEGSILIKNMMNEQVIAKDYYSPNESCLGDELSENFGIVPTWFVKIFDAKKFKQHILHQLHQPEIDVDYLYMLAVVRFAFINNTASDLSTPSWVFIFNFAAFDMIGDPKVLNDLLKSDDTPITPQRKARLKENWSRLRKHRTMTPPGQLRTGMNTIGFGAHDRPALH